MIQKSFANIILVVLILMVIGTALYSALSGQVPSKTDTLKTKQTNGITLEEALDLERRGNNPQITLRLIGPAEVFPGTMIVYTIEYTSTGMGTAKNIIIQNTFPDGSEDVLRVGNATPGWTGRVQLIFMVPPLTSIGTFLEDRVGVRFENLSGKPFEPVSTIFQTTVRKSPGY